MTASRGPTLTSAAECRRDPAGGTCPPRPHLEGSRLALAPVYRRHSRAYDTGDHARTSPTIRVKEIQVEIADEPGGPTPEAGSTPYQNLWIPLVLVPAGIVMAIVLIVALFGNLAGGERTPAENLELVAGGGKNERTQALMALTVQQNENLRARQRGEEPPWEYGEGFEERVQAVLDGLAEDDHSTRITLANLLAGLGNSAAVPELIRTLSLDEGDDPGAKLRFRALEGLGLLGDGQATEAVLPFLSSDQVLLRVVAASALANLPGEGVREALIGALGDPSLLVRGTAAFSLAKLDPPGYEAAEVLVSMTGTEVYEAAREADPSLFTRAEDVSHNRIKALAFLAHLGRDEDWQVIASLREDPDLNVRDQVLTLLADRDADKP